MTKVTGNDDDDDDVEEEDEEEEAEEEEWPVEAAVGASSLIPLVPWARSCCSMRIEGTECKSPPTMYKSASGKKREC